MLLVPLLLLLFQCAVATPVCTDIVELLAVTFPLCQEDPICADNYYLTPVMETWELPRFNHLLTHVILKTQGNVTIICSSEEVYLEWFKVISWWDFCRRNEIWSTIHGECLCVSGKNCNKNMSGTNGYSFDALVWIMLIVLIGGGYFVVVVIKQLYAFRDIHLEHKKDPQKTTASVQPTSQPPASFIVPTTVGTVLSRRHLNPAQ